MVAWLLKVTPLCLLTMSPELTALLTRIDALVEDGVCTPAEAVEQRRRAFNTEVRTPPFRRAFNTEVRIQACSSTAKCTARGRH